MLTATQKVLELRKWVVRYNSTKSQITKRNILVLLSLKGIV